jgi:hypothetical protein
MHNDDLSYAETFETALEGLFGEAPPEAEAKKNRLLPAPNCRLTS